MPRVNIVPRTSKPVDQPLDDGGLHLSHSSGLATLGEQAAHRGFATRPHSLGRNCINEAEALHGGIDVQVDTMASDAVLDCQAHGCQQAAAAPNAESPAA